MIILYKSFLETSEKDIFVISIIFLNEIIINKSDLVSFNIATRVSFGFKNLSASYSFETFIYFNKFSNFIFLINFSSSFMITIYLLELILSITCENEIGSSSIPKSNSNSYKYTI
jgi:hypothetical protein